MKSNEHHEHALADLNKKLAVIQRDQSNPLMQAVASYELVKEVVSCLSQRKDSKADPLFNKIIYPQFLSLLIYYRYLAIAFSREPFDRREQIIHFKQFCKKLKTFHREHQEVIQYCRSGATDRDEYYFGNNSIQLLPEENPVYIWSKYLAGQRLYDQFILEIAKRRNPNHQNELVWTAPKTNLIELLYALHASNSFNDGKAGLKQVAEAFERIFQVSLGNYYRVFQDIRQRKINQTVFLDQLKEKFLQRVHEME